MRIVTLAAPRRRAAPAPAARSCPRSPPSECSCRRGCDRRRRCRRARPAASTSRRAATATGYAACLAPIRMRPVVARDRCRGVRRMLQRIVGAIGPAFLDGADLRADRDHRVDEAVELGLRFALGRLDHQRAGDREAHRRRVEAVVHQPLRDVVDRDVRASPSAAAGRGCIRARRARRAPHRAPDSAASRRCAT